MIAVLADLLFRCPHRRLTRPITPVSKPGAPAGETYVVCLECGKQFYYDWEKMRLGGPVETCAAQGVLPPERPRQRTGKLKYALIGTAIPLAMLVGNAFLSKPRRHKQKKTQAAAAHPPKDHR